MKKLGIITLCIFLISLSVLFYFLKGSYPNLSGYQLLPGLGQPVVVERDLYGIPTIQGISRVDVARATGFLHGQDRFFQMDLMRRAAAGELAELFGEAVIEFDKERRLHCFRKQAQLILPTLTSFEQNLLKAYTEGVNTGLNALTCRPFEYLILREKPASWKGEDSILVGLGLFFDLQDPLGATDWTRGILKMSLPTPVYEFFTQNGSAWDAPLDQSSLPLLPIPGPENFQYLKNAKETPDDLENNSYLLTKGSNQWAVSPSLTASRRAILACDMHLNLLVPNIWYRLAIDYPDAGGRHVQVSGVSLPGTPLIAVGSNRHVAWGFTNAYIDTTDLILLDIDSSNDHFYLTPEGPCPFEERIEEIKIKGRSSSIYHKIPWTKWGPVHPKQFLGKWVAIRWIAHDLNCFNFRLIDLETIVSSQAALQSLPNIHLPVLNFMVADKEGHIGWSFVGGVPKRYGYEPGLPISFTHADKQWVGNWTGDEYPILIDAESKYLWTANNRVLNCPSLGRDYLNSIRAYQIRQRLFQSKQHTLTGMYGIQLDDEAFFFERWHHLLVKYLDLKNPKQHQLHSIISHWDHHCSASSKEYFWIRTFREMAIHRISKRLLSPCFSIFPELNLNILDLEEPVYMIISEQPAYLVDPDLGSWEVEVSKIIEDMLDKYCEHLAKQSPWGSFNRSSIRHPLSQALSLMSFLLDMPKKTLAGDYYVPRVASPSDGASVRLVVSPGYEEEGILNVPCGQSGHPLSKHYRDQHDAWLEGRPTPFLPGPPLHQLHLVPN